MDQHDQLQLTSIAPDAPKSSGGKSAARGGIGGDPDGSRRGSPNEIFVPHIPGSADQSQLTSIAPAAPKSSGGKSAAGGGMRGKSAAGDPREWLQKIKPQTSGHELLEPVFLSAHWLKKKGNHELLPTHRAAFALRKFTLVRPQKEGMKQQECTEYPNIFELKLNAAFMCEYYNHNPGSFMEGGGGRVFREFEAAIIEESADGDFKLFLREFEAAISDQATERHSYLDCLDAALPMCDAMYRRAGTASDYDEAASIESARRVMHIIREKFARPPGSKADIRAGLDRLRRVWLSVQTDFVSRIQDARVSADEETSQLLQQERDAFTSKEFALAKQKKEAKEDAKRDGERAVQELQVRCVACE
jgi:hypothetical protein